MKLAVAAIVFGVAAASFASQQDLPDFLKDVERFNQISRELAAYRNHATLDRAAENQIRKDAKTLEDRADRILDYLLDGAEAPDQQSPKSNVKSLADRLAVLDATASSVVRKARQYVADQRKDEVDARLASDLIEDLQAIKLIARDLRRANTSSSRAAVTQPTFKNAATGMEFVHIPPGEFMMGCSGRQNQCDRDEIPTRRVRITKEFEAGIYEVTQAQWVSVMKSNPSHFNGPDLPVEQVSWNDVQEFLEKLNALHDGYHYRLPTEAEWEYAARAGSTEARSGSLDEIAWYSLNSGSHTHPVGQKRPNAWGLYDTLGNVWEWVQDWYEPEYYKYGPDADPAGPETGQSRALRGGSWFYLPLNGRVSYRDAIQPDGGFDAMGFRCVREKSGDKDRPLVPVGGRGVCPLPIYFLQAQFDPSFKSPDPLYSANCGYGHIGRVKPSAPFPII
jgi:formylglycine-generating enzyme required for sulfatase activity